MSGVGFSSWLFWFKSGVISLGVPWAGFLSLFLNERWLSSVWANVVLDSRCCWLVQAGNMQEQTVHGLPWKYYILEHPVQHGVPDCVQQLYTTPYLAAYGGRDIVAYCVTSCFEDCEDTTARGQLASYCSTGVILVPLIKRESTA